ncbi:MAG: hypothetical protein M9914_05985 [Trueperaceae bacterium]|nr:hypothetical protein [Trueperaceae bacterium]
MGKDVRMRVDRKNRGEMPVDTHTVAFTSSAPQDLILITRFKGAEADNWTFHFEGRQATVTFDPDD